MARTFFILALAAVTTYLSLLVQTRGSELMSKLCAIRQNKKPQVLLLTTIIPLTLKREPEAFAAPPCFADLRGRCFSLVDNAYEYVVCPYNNITQSATATYDNFRGVLGIWSKWEDAPKDINTTAVVEREQAYGDGTDCNYKPRESRVQLVRT